MPVLCWQCGDSRCWTLYDEMKVGKLPGNSLIQLYHSNHSTHFRYSPNGQQPQYLQADQRALLFPTS